MATRKTTRVNSRLLSRLHSDLKELFANPYPGINVFHHPNDLRKFCLVLMPLGGPYLGLRLHFRVELPETWPVDPPRIKSSSNLNHPNVFNDYICSDLLRLYSEIPEEGYTGGYTPAFTLGGLFMQFLSFFSSEEVEQEGGLKVRIGNRIEETYHLWEVLQSRNSVTGIHYNRSLSSKIRDLYLREVEAGGNTEHVHTRYDAHGERNAITVWQPHSGEKFKTIKTTWENTRYSSTLKNIQRVKCNDCGYGSPSMPCTIPIQIPGGNHSDAISWADIEKARKASENVETLREKKIRNLKRKLREIALLKGHLSAGENLEANQVYKLSTYDKVFTEIEELEAQKTTDNSTKRSETSIESVSSLEPLGAENPEGLIASLSVIEPSHNTGICHLTSLNNDVLLMIAAYLPSESLINFGKVYPHVHALTIEHHVLLQRELKCFFLRTPLNHPTNLLGVGVHIDAIGGLESSFDWLSMDAFELFKVRKSIDKKEFEFFLPLGFSVSHFGKAYESGKLFEYIDTIGAAIPRRWAPVPGNRVFELNTVERRLRVLYKFCNSIVVSLMRTTDDLYSGPGGATGGKEESAKTLLFASEKACIGYLQIYHLLLCIMRKDPELRRRALARLEAFCAEDASRAKSSVPDLGEFLVMAAVVAGSHNPEEENRETRNELTIQTLSLYNEESGEDGWTIAGGKQKEKAVKSAEKRHPKPGNVISWRGRLVGPFINEVLTRNVRWVIQKHPSLAIIDNSPPEHRMRTTFNESRTSLRLVMFQVFFLETFTAIHITRQMENQYGFAGPEVPAMITKGIKDIYSVGGWKKFFERIGFGEAVESGPSAVNRMLKDAVARSQERGYHKTPRNSGRYQGGRRVL